MTEDVITCILGSEWVPKVGKHVVRLSVDGSKARKVWMTEKQLCQLERCFSRTPHGHSSQRLAVVGIWNDRGYYAYAKVEAQSFIEPPQYDLKDLREEEL